MSTYQQQLAKCKDTDDENSYSSIWRNSVWTITDYEELFEDIDRGYIIQDPEDVFFIINPDWEEEEEEEDSDDEKEKEEEKKQIDILKSQSVWKIYFGAVLQDIREPNWREEEKEKKNCIECNVVITEDNIYEPNDCYDEPDDLCDKCGDDYNECSVCNKWTNEDDCYRDKDGDAMNLCNDCGDSEFQEIEDNVEKMNEFVENYKNGEYIAFNSTEVDAIMKLINKLL